MVPLDFTLFRLKIAYKKFKESGLADAVGPHNGNTRAHVDTKVNVHE